MVAFKKKSHSSAPRVIVSSSQKSEIISLNLRTLGLCLPVQYCSLTFFGHDSHDEKVVTPKGVRLVVENCQLDTEGNST